MDNLTLKELLSDLPQQDEKAADAAYRAALAADRRKVIVLDDDPTGVQTVHGVYVYTDWSAGTLDSAFADGHRMSFILTNSRGLTEDETAELHRLLAVKIDEAARRAGEEYAIISRGDSTLRGHYPLETESLRAESERLGNRIDGEIIMPFFPEGGRYTINDIHYVADGDRLVPAGDTEFAKDRTFGYKSSDLKEYIEEKSKGRYAAKGVVSISLRELRSLDYGAIQQKLTSLTDFGKAVVNAENYTDVKVFTTALLRAMALGKRYMFRTAAAFTRIMGGVKERPPLTRGELIPPDNRFGGLVIAGSHVKKTTMQLGALHGMPGVSEIEFNQHLVVDDTAFSNEIDRVVRLASQAIESGQTAVVFTRRERFDLNNGNREDELRLAVKISDAVTSIAARIPVRPCFIIAKGGITSSDVGSKALGCKKALVMGQLLKGIPVWQTGPESRFPDMPYVIFPGNVGDENALRQAVEIMSAAAKGAENERK